MYVGPTSKVGRTTSEYFAQRSFTQGLTKKRSFHGRRIRGICGANLANFAMYKIWKKDQKFR